MVGLMTVLQQRASIRRVCRGGAQWWCGAVQPALALLQPLDEQAAAAAGRADCASSTVTPCCKHLLGRSNAGSRSRLWSQSRARGRAVLRRALWRESGQTLKAAPAQPIFPLISAWGEAFKRVCHLVRSCKRHKRSVARQQGPSVVRSGPCGSKSMSQPQASAATPAQFRGGEAARGSADAKRMATMQGRSQGAISRTCNTTPPRWV